MLSFQNTLLIITILHSQKAHRYLWSSLDYPRDERKLINRLHGRVYTVLDFQKKILGPTGPQVFIFGHQNKYSSRQKLYLRTNGIK